VFATLVLALTLAMMAAHVGEWLLLWRLAGDSRHPPRGKQTAKQARFSLMDFLRWEALYYVVLVIFWLRHPAAVPAWAVLFLGAVHIAGWVALESRKALPRLETVANEQARSAPSSPPSGVKGEKLRRMLAGIAAFDLAEVAVLAYLAYLLWP
jgi:hypothetical protein